MSEEQVVEQTENANAGAPAEVSQQDLADQAFNDLFGDSTPKETAKPAEKPQQVAQPQQPKAENKEVQQPAQKPEGIFSTFFKEDNGQQVFDAETVDKLFSAKPEYEYKGPQFAPDAKPPEPPKDPFDEMWEKRESYRKELEGGAYIWRDNYVKAINSGYSAEQAQAYADGQVNKVLSQEIERHNLDWQKEFYKTQQQKMQEELEVKELSVKARSNEKYLENLAGGRDKYEHIMYSKDFGGKVLHWLYAMGGNQPNNQAEYNKGFEKWAYKFFSNAENASMAYNLSLGLVANHPQTRKAYNDMVAVSKDRQARQNAQKTNSQKPTGLTPKPKEPETNDVMDWMTGGGKVPSV